MKRCSFIILIFACIQINAQSIKEKNFLKTTKAVLAAWNQKDSTTFSKYMKKDIGFYLLYNRESELDYRHYKTISFSDSSFPDDYPKIDALPTALKYDSIMPNFDCAHMLWDKTGTYCDTSTQSRVLSYLPSTIENNWKRKVPTYTIDQLFKIQKNSRQVIVTNKDGSYLIFYITYLNKQWYITTLDYRNKQCLD